MRENLKLQFDPMTGKTSNREGVEVRVKMDGKLASVEQINDNPAARVNYFGKLTEYLIKNYGYRRDENIRGAPYDFRKAPYELGEYFDNMEKTLSEMKMQYHRKVTIICHSMGCLNTVYFLGKRSKSWKDEHIQRVISIGAPWGGSAEAVKAMVFGNNLQLPFLFDEKKLRELQRSFPGTIYLLPHPALYGNTTLVKTNVKDSRKTRLLRASDNDYKFLFNELDYDTGYQIYQYTKDLQSMAAPEVEMWCLYGRGFPTVSEIDFDGEISDSEGREVFGDGDGTVSIKSSLYCREWVPQQKEPVRLRGYTANHIEILKDPYVLGLVGEIVSRENYEDISD